MKRILIYLSIALLLLAGNSYAEEKEKNFDFSIKGAYSIYQDKDLAKDGKGIKGELRYKYAYLWGSWEQTELRLTGQRAGDIALYGVGLGGKVMVLKPFSIFLEVGYYIPSSELEDNAMTYREGVYYKWLKTLTDCGLPHYASQFTRYTYKLKPGFGGSIGLELNQQIYKMLYINLFGAYRFLNLNEDWDAYDPDKQIHNRIQTKEKRDFSGGIFGVGVTYKF